MEENKNIEINLKMLFDMEGQNVEITNVKVTSTEQMSFKDKVFAYLEAEVKSRSERLNYFRNNALVDSEQLESYRMAKNEAEKAFWQAQNYLEIFRLF